MLAPVLAFVNANFQNPDNWKAREAALMAYGSIMDGPNSIRLAPMVASAFVEIAKSINDPVVYVRDTSAWALCQIATFHPEILCTYINDLVPVLCDKLKHDRVHISTHIAGIFRIVGDNLRPKGDNGEFFLLKLTVVLDY